MWSQAHRYVFRQTALTTLGAAAAFAALVWLVYSLRFLDLLGSGAVPAAIVLELALLNLPRFLAVAMPLALFAAIVLVFRRLSADGELVALRAAGFGDARLAVAPMAVALLVAAATAAINLWLAPEAARSFRTLDHAVRTQLPLDALQPGRFLTPRPGLTLLAGGRDAEGRLSGILIHDARRTDRTVSFTARQGTRLQAADGPRIVLLDGARQERDAATGRVTTVGFERYVLAADGLEDGAAARRPTPSELPLRTLLRGGSGWAPAGTATRLAAEGHHRLAGILHGPAMAAAALLLLLHTGTARERPWRRTAAAALAALALQAAILAARWAAARHAWLVPAVYAVPLLPLAAGAMLLMRSAVVSTRPDRPSLRWPSLRWPSLRWARLRWAR